MVNYFRYLYDYYRFGFDKCRNNCHNPVMTTHIPKAKINGARRTNDTNLAYCVKMKINKIARMFALASGVSAVGFVTFCLLTGNSFCIHEPVTVVKNTEIVLGLLFCPILFKILLDEFKE